MAAPFALTYTPEAAPLPDWLSVYSVIPTLTTIVSYTYATADAAGAQTLVQGAVTATLYETQIVQLPITVDVDYSVGGIYTNAGGTGPTVLSVLGATGSLAAITVQPSISETPFSTVSPVSSLQSSGALLPESARLHIG